MSAGQVISQPLGVDRPWQFTLYDANGAVADDYALTDPLACSIWSGQDQAVLASPTATWIDTTSGTVQVVVAATDTANLGTGLYRMTCRVTHDGSVIPFFDGSIELTPAPGSTAAPAVYCSYDQLRLYGPQIQILQDQRTDLAGFAGERARARTWTNERVLDCYRPQPGRARRYVDAAGTSTGPYLRWVTSGPSGASAPTLAALRTALAAGGLRLTDKVVEANAHYTAAIVYLNQPGRDNPYHQLGAIHLQRAEVLLAEAVVEIDTSSPLDGVYDVRIGRDVTWLT